MLHSRSLLVTLNETLMRKCQWPTDCYWLTFSTVTWKGTATCKLTLYYRPHDMDFEQWLAAQQFLHSPRICHICQRHVTWLQPAHSVCCTCLITWKPSHWICKPAYLVPVTSQDKLGGLRQEGHPAKNWGWWCWLVWMEWHPARLSVCLPLLSSLHQISSSATGLPG